MDEKLKGAAGAEKSIEGKEKSNVGAAILLSFPPNHPDPSSHLTPLRDKYSAYTAVAKACLQLNQYALNGSSSAMDDVHSVDTSFLFHDASFAAIMSGAFNGLMETIQNHDDRRAKILCCKTLALVARATYARIRHSPHLFAMRDSTNNRLEDEVGTEIPMTLITAALEDPDDGVAASAIHALGIMVLSTMSVPGTLVEDELLREILEIVQGRPSPYSPTLEALSDEDTCIPQMELQTRIFENILSPRLLQLVYRVTAFDSSQHIRMILPVLTASLVHMSKISPPMIYGMDRKTYAKRWVELDSVKLVNDVVEGLLLPSMKSSLDGHLSYAAATASIRLVHACPHAPWVNEVLYWAILVMKEELACVESLEAQMTTLATLLICARAVSLPERFPTLHFVFSQVLDLPSTTSAPFGINSPGLLLEVGGVLQYRRPARVAFLTEIALSFLSDGPVEGEGLARSEALERFFTTSEALDGIKDLEGGNVTQFREEFVISFCTVAVQVGRRFRRPAEGDRPTHLVVIGGQSNFVEWIRMSLTMLEAFSSCLSWGELSPYMEEDLSLLVAAQASYVRLVQEVLHAAGLLNPTSVSLRMAAKSSPPNILWDQMEESAAFLGKYEAVGDIGASLLESISKLMDGFIQKELMGRGVASHHLRLYILSLAADHWAMERFLAMHKDFSGDASKNMNFNSASNLLTALSPQRLFDIIVESHKDQTDNYSKKKKELYKKYTQDTVKACVACIENIALGACLWRKRFGKSADVNNIVNLAVQSLQARSPGNDDSQALVPSILSLCQDAVERIQARFSKGDQTSIESMSVSILLSRTGKLKRRPVITASRNNQGQDAYNEGYMTQLIRQIIASRADRYVLSTPPVYAFNGPARKQNWLRLALPPMPYSRNPQVSVDTFPRFTWGSGVSSVSGGSDAAVINMAYSLRRNLRYDSENEFRLMLTMRVHNVTAVEVPEGLRLELGILNESAATSLDSQDPTSAQIMESLLEGSDEVLSASVLSSATTIYKPELKSGDHLSWEIMMGTLPMTGPLTLYPSIVYRAMEDEPAHATWVGTDLRDGDGDTSVVSGVSQQSTDSKKDIEEEKKEKESKPGRERRHINIPGQSLHLSPMVGLQPCPLVFFKDGCGDIDTFRFLWSRMTSQIPALKVAAASESETVQVSCDTRHVAAISMIRFEGESTQGRLITKLWAFIALNGSRVLCVMTESEVDADKYGSNEKTIHVRGDDKQLLSCLTGTLTARRHLVAALESGLYAL